MMKRIELKSIAVILILLLPFGCKKKESDVVGPVVDNLAKDWVLENIIYTNDEITNVYTFTPYEEISLSILKGGRYEAFDEYGLLNLVPIIASEADTVSLDVQTTYGSWEFTNESKPDQIVFNKGGTTYEMWYNAETPDIYPYYYLNNPELVYTYKIEDNKLTLTSTDNSLMYSFGYFLGQDDARFYDPTGVVAADNYNDGFTLGEYFGYAKGYNDGAVQVYTDSLEDLSVYRKDPFNIGFATGKLAWYTLNEIDSLDYTATPNYESGWTAGQANKYNEAYQLAVTNASRASSGAGKIELVFRLK